MLWILRLVVSLVPFKNRAKYVRGSAILDRPSDLTKGSNATGLPDWIIKRLTVRGSPYACIVFFLGIKSQQRAPSFRIGNNILLSIHIIRLRFEIHGPGDRIHVAYDRYPTMRSTGHEVSSSQSIS